MRILDIVGQPLLNEAGSWQDIYAANKSTIANPNKIQVGQKITLPGGGTYTVQKGDTLSKIARQQSGSAVPASATTSQGAKPSAASAPVAAAVKGAENLTPYSTAADVAGVTGLAAAAGQFLPKVGGVIAKAVPGLNVAYQGADALRRASLGDYTGSAISAAGAVPVLGLPAVAAHAIRDKYRTGSFFPSDEELKTAVDKDKGIAATPAVSQDTTPKLKEGNKTMNQKQLKQRIKKLEEDRAKLQEAIGSFARAGAKYGGALKSRDFGKMLSGLGTDLKPPADVTRKAGQTFDRVRGTGASGDAMVQNRRTGDVIPLSDIGKSGSKSSSVWRKGSDAGATSTAAKTAGTADNVAAAAKGGKPLSRTATALAAAAGGGLVGYGLGSGEKGQGPLPTPDTTPTIDPTPRPPNPNKPAKDDPYDLQAVGTNTRPGPGSEQWLRSELGKTNKPTASTSTEPSQADIDAATKANTANAANVAADVNARLGAEKSRADFAKSAASASPSSDSIGDVITQKGSASKPAASGGSDEKYPLRDKGLMGAEIKYRQDLDGRKYTDPTPTAPAGYRQPETRYYSGDDVKGMFKEDKLASKQNVIPESINTELNDILWLAGRQKR